MRDLPVRQFLTFALIGMLNTLVDLLVMNVETLLTGLKHGLPFALQKGVSFMTAVFFSYYFNKRFTFHDKSTDKDKKKLVQFFIISSVGMTINVMVATLVVTLAGRYANINSQVMVNVGALCGTASGLIWNFIGYKLWVFKHGATT
ncbi:MAG: GtrA family protein [Nitrospirae bacterium]|nr:GtrA family protein [Nitrospirota bacterium]